MQLCTKTNTHYLAKVMVILFVFIFPSYAKDTTKDISFKSLKKTPIPVSQHTQTQAIGAINRVIKKEHFKDVKLNDKKSKLILKNYLGRLDPAKMYFLQEDVEEFNKHQTKFDDYIKTGNLSPVYAIFHTYRERVEQQIKFALKRVKQPFDFTLDEKILIDSKDASWAENKKALKDRWRKRIKNDILGQRLSKKDPEKIIQALSKRYLHIARVTRQFKADDVFQIFINAYAATIEPHTFYYTPQAVENFKIHMGLSLEGIGAVLQTDNEYTQIVRIIPGGPADLSNKLHPDDRIIGVGQNDGEIIDTIGWPIDEVARAIRGKKMTEVRLEIISGEEGIDGEPKIVSIMRDEVKLEEEAAKKRIIEVETGNTTARIGVIDLPSFYIDFEGRDTGKKNYRRTTSDVRKLLTELKNEDIDGLVVDLRGNGGGGLDEAVEMAGLFIPQGPVVQIEYANKHVIASYDPDPDVFYDGPLAVLVDRYSASASEIFAAAIQDYNRGLIIGESTYGKGTVQSVVPLNRHTNTKKELGNLKITIAQFFRVSGDSTQNIGVTPNIVWKLGQDNSDFGEKTLDNTIQWRQLATAEFSKYQKKIDSHSLDFAYNNHLKRASQDAHFNFAKEINAFNQTVKDRKYFSLMEKERKQQRKERNNIRLEIENKKRIALGEVPFDDIDGLNEEKKKKAKEERQKEHSNEKIDDFVAEAGRILADFIYKRNAAP